MFGFTVENWDKMKKKLIFMSFAIVPSIGAASFAPLGAGVASAQCIGRRTDATANEYAKQYNNSANTCDGDLTYTGRFSDLTPNYGIVMKADKNSDGFYAAGDYQSTMTPTLQTPNDQKWQYSDADSVSKFKWCWYNSRGRLVNCVQQGTNSGY